MKCRTVFIFQDGDCRPPGKLKSNPFKTRLLKKSEACHSEFEVVIKAYVVKAVPEKRLLTFSDNRSQFIAGAAPAFLKDNGILKEFSHVATPEEIAYIETLHSNLQLEVVDRFGFDFVYHARMVIERYYKRYNEKRKQGWLSGGTAQTDWNQYFNPSILITNNYSTNFERLQLIRCRYKTGCEI